MATTFSEVVEGVAASRTTMDESTLLEEVELLEAIYINELTVVADDQGRPSLLKVLLHPATGENAEQQYVCLTLEFFIPKQYPSKTPDITIRNPRGLADEHINSLRKQLSNLGKEREGGHMLYELIELAKESLTQCNTPHGNCIICLEDFSSTDSFIKTECYHYFHNYCLLRYINYRLAELQSEKEEAKKHKHMKVEEKSVVCPVCRDVISYDIESLSSTPAPADEQKCIQLSDDIRLVQQKMAALFEKQKTKGGIIDVEAEKNKYYLALTSISDETNESLSAETVTITSKPEEHCVRASQSVVSSNNYCENKSSKECDRPSSRGKQRGVNTRNNWRKWPRDSKNKPQYKEKSSHAPTKTYEKTALGAGGGKEERIENRDAEEIVDSDHICDTSAKSTLPKKREDEKGDSSRKAENGTRNKSAHRAWGRNTSRRNDERDGRWKQGHSSYKGRDSDRTEYKDTKTGKHQADIESHKKYQASSRRNTYEGPKGRDVERINGKSRESLTEYHEGRMENSRHANMALSEDTFPIRFNHGQSSKSSHRNSSMPEGEGRQDHPPGFRTVGPPPGFTGKPKSLPDFEEFR